MSKEVSASEVRHQTERRVGGGPVGPEGVTRGVLSGPPSPAAWDKFQDSLLTCRLPALGTTPHANDRPCVLLESSASSATGRKGTSGPRYTDLIMPVMASHAARDYAQNTTLKQVFTMILWGQYS